MLLIAGCGYRNLRDLSFGPELIDRLSDLSWPPEVQIEDFSYGAVAVYQWLLEHGDRFDRAIFVGAAAKGRRPGSLRRQAWTGTSEDDEAVQARIAEALTGVVSLDNLLVICERFGALPPEVSIIEVEPEDQSWGPGFSECVATRADEVYRSLCSEFGTRSVGSGQAAP